MLGQGQLDKNAVHHIVLDQTVNHRKEFFLCRILRHLDHARGEANLLAGTLLVADVHLGGGILPYNNHGQTGRKAMLLDKFFRFLGDLTTYSGGDLLTVNQFSHRFLPRLFSFLHPCC